MGYINNIEIREVGLKPSKLITFTFDFPYEGRRVRIGEVSVFIVPLNMDFDPLRSTENFYFHINECLQSHIVIGVDWVCRKFTISKNRFGMGGVHFHKGIDLINCVGREIRSGVQSTDEDKVIISNTITSVISHITGYSEDFVLDREKAILGGYLQPKKRIKKTCL